ncbi:angiopoietin-related protein 2-like [Drosophila albomicans]|uniref:Angiopoietin-related protein 2-like n=1 Tax=Drosophila albomicans TaxID=7291 RepID=A0A6P8ZDW8_DROAB|nr:angiopoietin-related protein 2-like [Drosophila albomicans]
MEYFNGTIRYADYDNFKVDGNEADYTLSSLGEFFGNEDGELWRGDNLRWHEGLKFSTFDNEHDLWNKECAQIHKGGWWYNHCTASNLNGLYSMHGSKYTQMYWTHYVPLKSVQMMIRKYQPK